VKILKNEVGDNGLQFKQIWVWNVCIFGFRVGADKGLFVSKPASCV
jgi:hypothetical protein